MSSPIVGEGYDSALCDTVELELGEYGSGSVSFDSPVAMGEVYVEGDAAKGVYAAAGGRGRG